MLRRIEFPSRISACSSLGPVSFLFIKNRMIRPRLYPTQQIPALNMNIFRLLKFISEHPVNEGQALRAMTRFIKWQISSRLAPGAIVYDWINGARFLVRTGETGLTGNIYTGLHEFADMGYLLHTLRSEDNFVDIGANLGSYTVLAGAVVGASGQSFEPIPATYSKLVENIRINHIEGRMSAFNIGLGEKVGAIRFTSDLDTVNHALSEDENSISSVIVDVTTLDIALKDIQPNFIKIDVEGYETQVLKGAAKTINNANLHSVIMELNGSGSRYGFDEKDILTMMLDAGFSTFSYDPIFRKLTNLNGKNRLSGNTIFIRDQALVRDRIHSAPKFRIFDRDI